MKIERESASTLTMEMNKVIVGHIEKIINWTSWTRTYFTGTGLAKR
jgi:hypothetical protein